MGYFKVLTVNSNFHAHFPIYKKSLLNVSIIFAIQAAHYFKDCLHNKYNYFGENSGLLYALQN